MPGAEAVHHLERCLQVQEVLDPDDRARRCDLLLALGEALGPAGEAMRTAEETAPEAFALAEVLEDSIRASEACQLARESLTRLHSVGVASVPDWWRWGDLLLERSLPGTPQRVEGEWHVANRALSALKWDESAACLCQPYNSHPS